MKHVRILFFLLVVLLYSCEPIVDEGRDLPPLPDEPEFTVTQTVDNPNRFVVSFNGDGFFNHLWDFEGGSPANSSLNVDTVFYQRAGSYDITLHAAAIGGGGTASSTQTVVVEEDAVIECNETLALLTNACTSKCWTLSPEAGSITVGSGPLLDDFFVSSGLDGAQMDDLYCFDFEESSLDYLNNNTSFSACAGYVVVEDYPIPANLSFVVVPSGTDYSDWKIVVSGDFWMGVEDSGNEYEIYSITETEMVLLTPIKPCDGSASPGWFTLTFIAN